MTRPDTAYTGPELCALPAREVIALLRRRAVSPAELIEAALTRLAQVEPQVNAVPTLCPERARARAAQVDPATLLAGLPLGIKDLTPVEGVRTTFGTAGMADHIPQASHPLVLLLEARGGIVLGKTNTPELGAGGHTFNDVFGLTRNPWNLSRSAGGSSGGAAVSLATGGLWLSHGSDFAGSLRTPASFNGIVGLRPSPGIAGGGPSLMGFTGGGLQGPMARDVRDCALFLDAMAGFDPRWPISFPPPAVPYAETTVQDPGPVRIAFSAGQGGFFPVEAAVEQVLTRALATLNLPQVTVEESFPPLPHLDEAFRALRALSFVGEADATPDHIRQHYKQTIRDNTGFARSLSLADYARAERQRSALYDSLHQAFARFDVLASAVTGVPAFPAEQEYPQTVAGQPMTDYIDWLRPSYLATTCGLPALSLPVGFTPDGLPVGLQLIGAPRGEARLLQIACLLEQALALPCAPIDPREDARAGG